MDLSLAEGRLRVEVLDGLVVCDYNSVLTIEVWPPTTNSSNNR